MVILGRTRCRDQTSLLMFQSHYLMMVVKWSKVDEAFATALLSWFVNIGFATGSASVHAEDPKKATSSLWWSSALGHSSRIWYLSKVNISSPQDDIWNSIFGNRLKFESQYLATAEFHIWDSIFGCRLTFDVYSFIWSQTCFGHIDGYSRVGRGGGHVLLSGGGGKSWACWSPKYPPYPF